VKHAALLIAASCAVACYSPVLQSPGYYCHPEDKPACPETQMCVNGRCVSAHFDGGVPDLSMPRDMGGGGSDGGTVVGCTGTTMCTTAMTLSNVNADTGGTQTAMGDTNQWLSVQTIENNSGLSGQRMRLRVTLTSPAGINFDLFVYRNSGGTQECSAVAGSSTMSGTSDVVNMDWGEDDGSIPNGSADDALVSIEVRAAAAAMCSAGQRWSLEVKGGP
jgi:hypothetical protein